MSLVFCVEHVGVRNNIRCETWFNGWPFPGEAYCQEVLDDTTKYNSDLFPDGTDVEGIRKWFRMFGFHPVASLICWDKKLDYVLKTPAELGDENYIYPILVHGGGMMMYQSFHQHGFFIHPRVLEDCRTGKAKILLHELNEGHGFNLGYLRTFIMNQAEKLQLPLSAFGFLDGNYKTPELQSYYGTKGFCMFTWENHAPLLNEEQETARKKQIQRRTPAPYHFISLNRRVRLHRQLLVTHIMKKWKDQTLYSSDTFLSDPDTAFANPNSVAFYGDVIKQGILTRELYDTLPSILDFPMSFNDTHVRTNLQEQAYLSLTTETMFFEENAQFFSEKIFKPIIFMQPFIIIGPVNSLGILHDLGYHTFEPFINESYDQIKDPYLRLAALLTEIDRLSKYSHDKMHTLVKQCAPILRNNLKTLKMRRDTHVKEQKLIKELKAWIEV